MQHKMIVALAALLLCTTAWAGTDANAPGQVRSAAVRPSAELSEDGAAPASVSTGRGSDDIPPGYQTHAPEPTKDEPPQIIHLTDGVESQEPSAPPPLWGPDVTVYSGDLKYLPTARAERMIAYDQSLDGTLYAAFVVPNGDTAWIYRSTNQGSSWAKWNGIYGPSSIWSSLELVVAEGDSDFVFFFAKRSSGNGDIYVGRWDFGTTMADLFSVKVDADTVVNFSACRDNGNPYYLYVAYESRAGNYNMEQLRSTDYGKTWATTGGEVVDNQTSPKPDICYGGGGYVYTVLRDLRQSADDSVQLRLKRSTDRGATWDNSVQVGSLGVPVYDPVVGATHSSPNTIWLVHTRDLQALNGSGDAVCYFYSTDNGANWANGSFIGPNSAEDECMPSIASYWNGDAATVCYPVIPGDSMWFTWASTATDWSTPEKVNDYEYTGWFGPQAGWAGNFSAVLYAGVGASGLYFDYYGLTGTEEDRPAVEGPAALDARPSPARNRTAISYVLPCAGWARVSVSDIAGREFAILSSGTHAAGAHSAIWNCETVPAGVYLVRVETSTASQTGRVVISR